MKREALTLASRRDIAEFFPFAAAALALLIVNRPAAWSQWPSD